MSHKRAFIRQQFAIEHHSGKAPHRDIAETLQNSEGELIAAHVGAGHEEPLMRAIHLQAVWPICLS